MRRLIQLFAALLALAILGGCAHPISMAPDMAAIPSVGTARIDKKVGYHLPETLRNLEVTTPGGGGDKVRYFPYRDLEAGFYKALSEVFGQVSKVADPKDSAGLKKAGIQLLFVPEIRTSSFSDSLVTWPPTTFDVSLVCTVTDADGTAVHTVRAEGRGNASFNEFVGNFSLSAQRGSNEALKSLVNTLAQSAELRR